MKHTTHWIFGVMLLSTAALVQAHDHDHDHDHERPDHYQGEPSETLEQAVANFSEYNQKLESLLAQDELSARQLNEVHQLTYTLENALEKIQEELVDLAEVLEEVHVGSETSDESAVLTRGAVYLERARLLID